MKREKILLVDDNVELAENMSEILTESGFVVDVFHYPKKALEAFVPGTYRVALLDIRMPEMDGIELYQQLKERDPGLAAIAITAYANDERVQAAIQEGVLVVVPKPLDVARLLVSLSSVFEGSVILIVEDDKVLAQNLAEILLQQNFSPRIAGTCQEARILLKTIKPSVVLVDCKLPDGRGPELADELCRFRSEREDCLIVLYSGHPRSEVLQGLEPHEKQILFFEKPLPIETFLRAITNK